MWHLRWSNSPLRFSGAFVGSFWRTHVTLLPLIRSTFPELGFWRLQSLEPNTQHETRKVSNIFRPQMAAKAIRAVIQLLLRFPASIIVLISVSDQYTLLSQIPNEMCQRNGYNWAKKWSVNFSTPRRSRLSVEWRWGVWQGFLKVSHRRKTKNPWLIEYSLCVRHHRPWHHYVRLTPDEYRLKDSKDDTQGTRSRVPRYHEHPWLHCSLFHSPGLFAARYLAHWWCAKTQKQGQEGDGPWPRWARDRPWTRPR